MTEVKGKLDTHCDNTGVGVVRIKLDEPLKGRIIGESVTLSLGDLPVFHGMTLGAWVDSINRHGAPEIKSLFDAAVRSEAELMELAESNERLKTENRRLRSVIVSLRKLVADLEGPANE